MDAPEVRQRTPMDCGPAALQSVLRGYGVEIGYERLIRRCEVDPREGSSIDKVEEVANALGVEAEQIMAPVDHVMLPPMHRGPMIAVLRTPASLTHFVVVWRADGERVQIMDPAHGRRVWIERQELLTRLYVHEMSVAQDAWNDWSHSEGFQQALVERMSRLGVRGGAADQLWSEASGDSSIKSVAALDASVRYLAIRPKGAEPAKELERLFQCARSPSCAAANPIPPIHWSVRDSTMDARGERQVTIRGVVLLLFHGRSARSARNH
jgi:predicted double-glycine peptidase